MCLGVPASDREATRGQTGTGDTGQDKGAWRVPTGDQEATRGQTGMRETLSQLYTDEDVARSKGEVCTCPLRLGRLISKPLGVTACHMTSSMTGDR